MINVKSVHPKSIINKFTVEHQTTASIGTIYRIAPYDGYLEGVKAGMGIATTSTRLITISNVTRSQSLLNSASLMGSGAVGYSVEVNVSTTNGGGDAFCSAGSLLSFSWTASKGDVAFVAVFQRAQNNNENI